MWYFYVLESLQGAVWYKGSTDNLKRRFLEHNQKRGGRFGKLKNYLLKSKKGKSSG